MAETLDERLTRIYAEAAEDLRKKLAKYLARYAAKDAQKRRQRDAGEITEEEYRDWVAGQVFRGNLWRQKVDQATGTLADANAAALQIINGERMGVFAESANYQAYQLTKDTGAAINFSIYDEDAVGRLLKDEPELLPRKKLDRAKDRGWNQKQIAGAVAQGIIQGESVPHLAKRIARDTASKNSGAMIRYARTAITGAQNAGRVETLRRGKALGIRCKKCWLATLDGRTRDSHREMDGQTVDVDEEFHTPLGSKMQFPGDMAGKPADIWNCRCTLTYEYEDYPQENAERIAYVEGVDEDGKPYRRSKLIKDMTYREWLAWRGPKTPKKPKTPGSAEPSALERKLRRGNTIESYQPDQWDEAYKHKDEEYRQAIADIKRREAELLERYRKLPPGPERYAISQQLSAITDEQQKVRSSIYNKYGMEDTVATLQSRKIPWVPLRRLDKPMDEDAIISKLCGGDKTKGSCASLGFAYVGQKAGLDVIDFRGGDSQEVFSRKCVSMLRSFRENGLDVKTGTAKSYITAGKRVLAEVQEGREYYFECARHAAIVRKVGDELQYLELQSGYQNGWMPFSQYGGIEGTLNRRFGAPKSSRGWEVEALMVDVEEMGKNDRFTKCLGYINTEADKQKKGAGGHER